MKLTIIGASGHGRVCAEIACKLGYTRIEFLDDRIGLQNCGRFPVVGTSELATQLTTDIFVAIGDSASRRRLMETLFLAGCKVPSLIHPSAVLAMDVEIGAGSVVMAGTVVNPNVRVGCGAIINTCSSLDHDCVLGDYVHVAVGAHLCGNVTVGDNTWIGAGATVINNLSLGANVLLGAGAVAVKNLDAPGTYVGVPAHRQKSDGNK